MTREALARVLLSLAALAFAAWVVLSGARWVRHGIAPDPDSDLDVPRLFTRSDVRWKELERIPPGGVPVLCYHYFREGVTAERVLRVLGAVLLNMPSLPDNDYWTTPLPEFERQMRWLHEAGYRTITLDELADWLDGRVVRPERAVVLTIDDGDESVARLAAPVLRRYGFQATLFMLTGRAGERGWNGIDFLDWPTLRALEREGVLRVESHTHDMHTKVPVEGRRIPRFMTVARDAGGRVSTDSPLGRDLARSREVIHRELGREPRFLAWPFGFGTATVDSVAHAVGFRRLLTLDAKRNLRDFREQMEEGPPDGLGRYTITARTSFRVFRLMVEGGRPAGAANRGRS